MSVLTYLSPSDVFCLIHLGRLLALYRSQHSPVNQNALTRTSVEETFFLQPDLLKQPFPPKHLSPAKQLSRSSWGQGRCSSATPSTGAMWPQASLHESRSLLTLMSSCDVVVKQKARAAKESTFLSLYRSMGASFTQRLMHETPTQTALRVTRCALYCLCLANAWRSWGSGFGASHCNSWRSCRTWHVWTW